MCPPSLAEDASDLTRLRQKIEVAMRSQNNHEVVTSVNESVLIIDRMMTMLPAIRRILIKRGEAASTKLRQFETLDRMEIRARITQRKFH